MFGLGQWFSAFRYEDHVYEDSSITTRLQALNTYVQQQQRELLTNVLVAPIYALFLDQHCLPPRNDFVSPPGVMPRRLRTSGLKK